MYETSWLQLLMVLSGLHQHTRCRGTCLILLQNLAIVTKPVCGIRGFDKSPLSLYRYSVHQTVFDPTCKHAAPLSYFSMFNALSVVQRYYHMNRTAVTLLSNPPSPPPLSPSARDNPSQPVGTSFCDFLFYWRISLSKYCCYISIAVVLHIVSRFVLHSVPICWAKT